MIDNIYELDILCHEVQRHECLRVKVSLLGELKSQLDLMEGLPSSVRRLTRTTEASYETFKAQSLKLILPLVAVPYLQVHDCPSWLQETKETFINIQHDHQDTYRTQLEQKMIAEEDAYLQLVWKYHHQKWNLPLVKRLLTLFSDDDAARMNSLRFIDKYGAASSTLIRQLQQHSDVRLASKAADARTRYTKVFPSSL